MVKGKVILLMWIELLLVNGLYLFFKVNESMLVCYLFYWEFCLNIVGSVYFLKIYYEKW